LTEQWWAVWLAECPEEGSVHVRAASAAEAKAKAQRFGCFQWDDDEPLELHARAVTDEEHTEWEASDA
jgi:hypothetical protein